jgi:hypothetical protein
MSRPSQAAPPVQSIMQTLSASQPPVQTAGQLADPGGAGAAKQAEAPAPPPVPEAPERPPVALVPEPPPLLEPP